MYCTALPVNPPFAAPIVLFQPVDEQWRLRPARIPRNRKTSIILRSILQPRRRAHVYSVLGPSFIRITGKCKDKRNHDNWARTSSRQPPADLIKRIRGIAVQMLQDVMSITASPMRSRAIEYASENPEPFLLSSPHRIAASAFEDHWCQCDFALRTRYWVL